MPLATSSVASSLYGMISVERRGLRTDAARAEQEGEADAKKDVDSINDAELDFWDWPRVRLRPFAGLVLLLEVPWREFDFRR